VPTEWAWPPSSSALRNLELRIHWATTQRIARNIGRVTWWSTVDSKARLRESNRRAYRVLGNPLGSCRTDSSEPPCNPLGNCPTDSSEPPTSVATNISSLRGQCRLKLSPWKIHWAASQRIDSIVYPSYSKNTGLGKGQLQLKRMT
jgi:hypothetical protein